MIDNFALYMWYALPAIIGAMIYKNKKKRWVGAVWGLVVAFVAITLFALMVGQ